MFFKKNKKEKTPQELIAQIEKLEQNINFLNSEIEKLKKENFVQKIGIIRYNPFSDIGGDQSFSISVLDKKDNGFVLTSIYAREGNRIYAKPIKNNNSEYVLSKEEKEAIKLCQKN
ncbi:MAG: DUF4446 family protein [Candidatus Pacebacteria bacterium]|nr:DUF4446 family protein [Candidatus Paceibacterota bacterium]